MAEKTVVCGICGEEVSKRKTLFIEEKGRVCRHHESEIEIERKKNEAIRQKIIKLEEERERKKLLNKYRGPICFHCGKIGTPERILYERIVFNLKKIDIVEGKGSYVPLLDGWDKMKEYLKEDFGTENIIPLKTFSISGLNKWQKYQLIKFRTITAEMLGLVELCQECAENFGFKK